MALTVGSATRSKWANKIVQMRDIAFDSSYAYGGESLDYTSYGFSAVDRVMFEPKNGLTFEYDFTNKKVKAFMAAPPIVRNELVTCTSKVGTLRYPAAYIMHVSSGNTPYKVIPGALTAVTGTVNVTEPVWGTRPTLTFYDSVTTCYVTYVAQAWKEVFDNYVQCVITAGARVSGHASASYTAGGTDVISLGELAVAIQSITWNDNGTVKGMDALYKGETAATTEATIDFSDTTTKLALLASDTMDASTDSVYINYIKKPASGFLFDRFVEEDDLTPATDISTVSSGLVSNLPLIYGSCGDLPGPTTAYHNIISSSEAVGSTATLVQPTALGSGTSTFTHGSSHADTTHVKMSYIAGMDGEIPGLVHLEVPNAFDLSQVTGVKVTLIGR